MLSDLLETELPYLRRYARAVMGAQDVGDQLVSAMIELKLMPRIEEGATVFSRVSLFRLLDETLIEHVRNGVENIAPGDPLGQMGTVSRRALMLISVEGFTLADAGAILGVAAGEVEAALADAETALTRSLVTSIMIIEDEPMIAAHISEIVKELGHTPVGVASTFDQAMALASGHEFGLILADIHLADGSSGIDAVNEIRKKFDVPVIYITAYPERLLTGEGQEPVFLIPKPFRVDLVKAVISQALLGRH